MANPYSGGFINQNQPLVDPETGQMTSNGRRFLNMLYERTGGAENSIYDIDNVAAISEIQRLGQSVEALQTDLEATRAAAEAAANRIVVRGTVDRKAIQQANAEDGFVGSYKTNSDALFDWYTGPSPAPATASSYNTLTLNTGSVPVAPGSKLEVIISYKVICVKDAIEHMTYRETVTLRRPTLNTAIETLSDYPFIYQSATPTVPTGYTSTEAVVQQRAAIYSVDIPDPLSGVWAGEDDVYLQLNVAMDTAASGGGADSIVGGTFNGANIATYLRIEDTFISIRARPPRINNL